MTAAPDATETMLLKIGIASFEMIGIIQRLGNKVPLQRSTVAAIHRKTFIRTPADAAMIDDDMFFANAAKGIIMTTSIYFAFVLKTVAHAKPEIAHNDIIATKTNGVIGDTDAITGRRLAGDRNIFLDADRG